MPSPTRLLVAGACVVLAGSLLTASAASVDDADTVTLSESQAELAARIDKLIEQLGAPSYAAREQAHRELEGFGLAAFEALNDALEHDDVEIAQRAKYLLRSMHIDWTNEDDPAGVQSILWNYGRLSEPDRVSRMDQLAGQEGEASIEPLCRIVRFEIKPRMSKEAAVRIIKQPVPATPQARAARAKTIRETMSISRRPSSQWLRAYADTLEDPAASADRWDRLVKAEYDAYNLFPEQTDREILRELLQFHADLLVQLDRREEASKVMLRWANSRKNSRPELLETIGWLVERKAWEVVNQLISEQADMFEQDAELLYIAADAYLKQGNRELADATADRAAAIDPENYREHVRLGSVLEDRGLKEWAEREYRHVTEHSPANSLDSIKAHIDLSEMLHDDGKELEAGNALQQFVTRMNSDRAVKQQLEGQRDPESIIARMHFFFAKHHHASGGHKKEAEHLQEAILQDPTDADVLIAMYRLPGQDEKWRTDTQELIATASAKALDVVNRVQQYLRGGNLIRNPTDRKEYEEYLAIKCNEYAWLVGNTTGDIDQAIRLSHRSLELRPNYGGFLDTLAHCYFGKKDYDSAVKYQRKAVEFEPHSGQIARALERFEEALAEQKRSKPESD
jgi:tetratricopeptide (TPR) repeat protein